MTQRKTVLFFPLNSPGHINSSLGIADKLKNDYGYRTVFLVLGSMIGTSIRDHGHELVILEEVDVYEDYQIEKDEDTSKPVDEELKRKLGKTKDKFPGAFKWPQLIMRHQHMFKLDPVDAFVESLWVMEKYMIDELTGNHDNYSTAIDSIKPDMIIIDAYYIPPCIVNLKHIPWVRLYSANPLMVTRSKLPGGAKPPAMCGYEILTKEKREKLRKEEPDKWLAMVDKWESATKRIVQAMGKASGYLKKFMEQHGCEPLEPGKQAHDSPHLNLYMFPKYFDYDQDDDLFDYPPRWFRCDSLIRKPTIQAEEKFWAQKLAEAMKGKKEMVFFSLGSIASGDAQLMKRYIDTLKHDNQRLYVVSKGVNGDKYELNPGNMIGDNYIPQTFFLERANLAIVHGGNNSTTECLYFGVPMIILPVFADQLDNAQRVTDLDTGRQLHIDCNGKELKETIDEVLSNKAMIEKCREIGKIMRARDDSRKISFMLNKLIEEKHLD